jgi:hypothetical protein
VVSKTTPGKALLRSSERETTRKEILLETIQNFETKIKDFCEWQRFLELIVVLPNPKRFGNQSSLPRKTRQPTHQPEPQGPADPERQSTQSNEQDRNGIYNACLPSENKFE